MGFFEEKVARAVAELLEDGEVIRTCYEFQSAVGELDGLVVGRWRGRDVVVLVKATRDMNRWGRKAWSELCASVKHWSSLKESSSQERDSDETLRADYQALRVAECGERDVVLALGCETFSESVFTRYFEFGFDMKTPWIYVAADSARNFTARHRDESFFPPKRNMSQAGSDVLLQGRRQGPDAEASDGS